jgi:MurNAc alpha-1-phosphate uridylyltransferase
MILIPNPESNPKGDVSLIDGYVRPDLEENKYTFSGIMIISPDLFSFSEMGPLELWNDILKPASSNNLVSGEIFKGRYENLNTLEDVERLDGLLSEE